LPNLHSADLSAGAAAETSPFRCACGRPRPAGARWARVCSACSARGYRRRRSARPSEPFAGGATANASDAGRPGCASPPLACRPNAAASEPFAPPASANASDARACRRCGAPLVGRRVDATTCSAACRAGWHRAGATPRAERLAARWGLLPRDFWRTPPELVAAVAGELGGPFGLDAASAGDDAVATRWLTPDEDARTARWAEACDPLHPRAWCNPPYSKVAGEGGAGLLTWVEAAVRARDDGLVVALLVPPSTSTRYWRLGCAEAAEILLLARRVAFLDPNTGLPQRGNRGDSAILIFRPGQRGPAQVRSWWPVEAT
jgi:phage N-6-adenine-methyltransferase